MMSLSSILIGSFIFFLILTLIIYLVLNQTMPSAFQSLSPNSGSLSKPTQIGNSSDVRKLFLSPSGSTLSMYILNNYNNKTSSIGSLEPIIIFKMGNAFQFQLLPGGASNNTKTQLAILTQGSSSSQVETIQLENLPSQKWVHLVIVREGRRYTVYYNGRIIGSDRINNYPVINSSSFIVGDTRLQGEFVYPKLAAVPYRISDVQKELAATSDTRHVPYRSYIELPSFNFGCPNGLFCFSTSSPPQAQPLRRWETPYA